MVLPLGVIIMDRSVGSFHLSVRFQTPKVSVKEFLHWLRNSGSSRAAALARVIVKETGADFWRVQLERSTWNCPSWDFRISIWWPVWHDFVLFETKLPVLENLQDTTIQGFIKSNSFESMKGLKNKNFSKMCNFFVDFWMAQNDIGTKSQERREKCGFGTCPGLVLVWKPGTDSHDELGQTGRLNRDRTLDLLYLNFETTRSQYLNKWRKKRIKLCEVVGDFGKKDQEGRVEKLKRP